ncbi:LysR family transcriptional regulator [Actinomadura flavalba]|uniref:LysR family transcriptional regulator n=1 Tax=Actinomadura flavalba TaxID=1120938 RepID=UPI00035E521C|nr:LysR family transcriptional regulator [Actinomadura flavalba]
MNLRQLRFVVATADHGTMTAAAQALFVAQPALSRAVRELERELGLELFTRSGRGVALTPTGERVAAHARAALAAVDAIESLAAAKAGGRGAELRIAVAAALEPRLTGRFVPGFARERPSVAIRVLRADDPAALVRGGEADLALTVLPVPGDLMAHPVEEREAVLVCAPGAAPREPTPVSALDGLPLVLPPGGPLRAELDGLLRATGTRPAITSDADAAGRARRVRAGSGAVLAFRDRLGDTPGLVVRSFTPPLAQTIGFVQAHRRLPSSAVDFLAFARETGRARP